MSDLIPQGEQFKKMVDIIEPAKERAYRKVNEKLADFFATNYPELKGFNCRGLQRMKQFYELYKDNENVSILVTQLNWSNHLKNNVVTLS